MTRERTVSTAVFLAAVVGMFSAASACKNSDTLTGLSSATATPVPTVPTPLSPTIPSTPTLTPASTRTPTSPAPSPTPNGLNGIFQGNVRYLDLDWWSPCGDAAIVPDQSATAIIQQSGDTITADIHTKCFSNARFQGTLSAGRLTGTMTLQTGDYRQSGASTGTASAARIVLLTPQLDVTPSPCPGIACSVGGFDLVLVP